VVCSLKKLTDLTLYLLAMWCWFRLGVYEKCQNNIYWSAENTMLFQEVPLHDFDVGMWCAISAARIDEPILIPETTF